MLPAFAPSSPWSPTSVLTQSERRPGWAGTSLLQHAPPEPGTRLPALQDLATRPFRPHGVWAVWTVAPAQSTTGP